MDYRMEIGSFVRYKQKNELGVVSEMKFIGARCWYRLDGIRAMTPYEIIEPINIEQVLGTKFSNEYAKGSLIERSMRLIEGGDVSDLIDDCDVRPEIKKLLKKGDNQNENQSNNCSAE